MNRIRLGTSMFLVVIAALAVALVVERRRSSRIAAEADAANRRAAMVGVFARQAALAARGTLAREAVAYGLDPGTFASYIATVDLGVPEAEVLQDLALIAKDLPGPLDVSVASAAYVVHRRDRKRPRAEAVRAARADLEMDATRAAVEKAAKK